jgi:peroxiredoxin
MKKVILIIIVLGMFGFAVYDFISSTDETKVEEQDSGSKNTDISSSQVGDGQTEDVGLEKGQVAPDFTLQTIKGETVHLSDYRGKRVIVNFWATWCPPCRAEIPDFIKLYKNKDVEILAVNLTETEKSREHVSDFVEEFGMTFPVLMDEKSKVTSTYQVRAYPTSYMIDSNGRIQFVAMGAMNYDLMIQMLEKMD